MDVLCSFQRLIGRVLVVGGRVCATFGLLEALRHRPDACTAAGKACKNIWLAVLGVAVALSFYSVVSPFTLPWILAVVGSGVYLADVRPALRRVIGRGSSNSGPYG